MKKVTLVASLLLAGLCSSVTYADESLDKVLKSDFVRLKIPAVTFIVIPLKP